MFKSHFQNKIESVLLETKLKGVNKVCSAIKLCSYYFSHYVSNDINVTGII